MKSLALGARRLPTHYADSLFHFRSLVALAILATPRPRCHEVVATDGEGHEQAPSVSGAYV